MYLGLDLLVRTILDTRYIVIKTFHRYTVDPQYHIDGTFFCPSGRTSALEHGNADERLVPSALVHTNTADRTC